MTLDNTNQSENPLDNSAPATSTLQTISVPATSPTANDGSVNSRLLEIETKFNNLIPVIESLILAVNALISDVRHFNIFSIGKDVTNVLNDVANIKSSLG
jgi:hypothetical protein